MAEIEQLLIDQEGEQALAQLDLATKLYQDQNHHFWKLLIAFNAGVIGSEFVPALAAVYLPFITYETFKMLTISRKRKKIVKDVKDKLNLKN